MFFATVEGISHLIDKHLPFLGLPREIAFLDEDLPELRETSADFAERNWRGISHGWRSRR